MPKISPLAIVEKGAKLAADVQVGAFSYIGPKVKAAAGCIIENNVTLQGKTILGEKNHIFPMAVIGTSPRDGKKPGKCVIGEANTIREHTTIYCAHGTETRIGNHNLIMIGCVIGPGARLANHGIFDNCSHIAEGAQIGDYVRMSGYAAVCPGRVVGEYAFVTGYTNVDRDAPPYARVQGFPMRIRGVNTVNLKRSGFGDDDIRAIKSAFREMFNGSSEFVSSEVLSRLLDDSNPHVRRLAEVVRDDEARRREQ